MSKIIETANGVKYYFHNEYGNIWMVEPKTLDRYIKLRDEQPNDKQYGIFFAFNKEQFKEGYDSLIKRGYIKDGDKVCKGPLGVFGAKGELKRVANFYEERDIKIKAECDPQEVYFHECNNHECHINGDDTEAMEIIIDIFGKEAAYKIHRVFAGKPTNILAPLTERDEHLKACEHELRMMGIFKWDMIGFFSEDDCRHYRDKDLHGGSVERFLQEVRETYNKLPDDIKDESVLSKEQIDSYAKLLNAWAEAEFAKPEYNPAPETKAENYKDLEITLDRSLYFKDDDGEWKTPTNIWFSCDTRRWRKDKRLVHGRAMTMFAGKKGTTLAPVYIHDYNSMRLVPYRREDLCNVSCDYQEHSLRDIRLTNFHRE